jgi:paraquat-inducible protein A
MERNASIRVFTPSAQQNLYPVMPEILLGCRDCGEIYGASGELLRYRRLLCRRCGARLWRAPSRDIAGPRAFAVTAAILLLLTNAFPLFEIFLQGDRRSGLIVSGAAALFQYDAGISAMGVLVGLTALAIPALSVMLLMIVLIRLRPGAGSSRPRAGFRLTAIWRAALRLRPWAMLDVFLLGAVVAYTRLDQLAQVAVGTGGYALAAFVLVQVLVEQTLGRQGVWNAIDDPAKYSPSPGAPWILCLDCDLVVSAHQTEGRGGRTRCPRCGAPLAPRRPGSLAATAALTLAGLVLYLPANLLPVLTITRFGGSQAYTIMGGIRDLLQAGLWPLALLVLLASIVVPVLKLTGLTWCLVAIRLRSGWLLRQRTAFYRFIDYIGRWSNIDVFVVAIVAALAQFGNITNVEPGPGIASFAAVVVLTMIAADAFDPRLMWDAAGRRG